MCSSTCVFCTTVVALVAMANECLSIWNQKGILNFWSSASICVFVCFDIYLRPFILFSFFHRDLESANRFSFLPHFNSISFVFAAC